MSKTLIVIPTPIGNEEVLNGCVSSIIKNTGELYKLVIVKNDFEGFAVSVNKGLKGLDDDYDGVVIMNDDTLVLKDWLIKMIEQANKEKKIGIVSGIRSAMRESHCAFICVYIKREVIDKIGILDERFVGGNYEDTDFCVRALDAGYDIVSLDCDVVRHYTSYTWQYNGKRLGFNKAMVENRERFKEKWKGTKWETKWDSQLCDKCQGIMTKKKEDNKETIFVCDKCKRFRRYVQSYQTEVNVFSGVESVSLLDNTLK